jgi:polyhydroxyalkanoate synthesis regulator phasin
MKIGIAAVLALLLGLVLGGYGPRSDLRQARARIKELEKKAGRQEASAGKMQAVKTMLQVKDAEVSAARGKPRKTFRPPPPPKLELPETAEAPVTNAPPRMGRNIAEAVELWSTRVEMSRNSFIGNLGLNPQQVAMFDGVTAVMNAQLEEHISQWAETLKQKDEMTSEDGIRMMTELGNVLTKTYDEMDQTLPQGWREKAGSGFDLVNFIDPAVATPLVDVENKIQRRQRRDAEFRINVQ